MDLDPLIGATGCLINDVLPAVLATRQLRRRDLAPTMVACPQAPRQLATITGYLICDRDCWSPLLTEDAAGQGVCLLALDRWTCRDPDPARSRRVSPICYGIETVFDRLVARYRATCVEAREPWHLASRFRRTALSHPIALRLNDHSGKPPRRLARLFSSHRCCPHVPGLYAMERNPAVLVERPQDAATSSACRVRLPSCRPRRVGGDRCNSPTRVRR